MVLLRLAFLNLRTAIFRIFEWMRVAVRYYPRDFTFLWIEALLASQYLFKNPHRVSRDFLKKRGEKNVYAFGETPLTTLDLIAKECRLLSKDTFFELGCGSARGCFWLRRFVKCKVVGIDFLPEFIRKANQVKKWARLGKIEFLEMDMFQADFHAANALYLYGTCMDDETIKHLAKRLEVLRPGTKVITVSYPLTEYSDSFKLQKEFMGRFPWGRASLFLNEKV
jgi:SAM-dependent methyltransferase